MRQRLLLSRLADGRGGTSVKRKAPEVPKEQVRKVESKFDTEAALNPDLEVVETSLDSEKIPPSIPRYENVRKQRLPRLLPFLREPVYRKIVANVPGDAGFDPLNLCRDVSSYYQYREAELKHGRLAMLAAVAWPVAEIAQPIASEEFGLPDVLAESGGRLLPQLNFEGGLGDQFVETFIGIVLFVGGFFEIFSKAEAAEPGDYGFDPLNLKSFSPPWQSVLPEKRAWMPEAEITHSRLAMMVVLYDVIDEILTGNPVVEDTEFVFHRLDAKFFSSDYWLFQPDTLDVDIP